MFATQVGNICVGGDWSEFLVKKQLRHDVDTGFIHVVRGPVAKQNQ